MILTFQEWLAAFVLTQAIEIPFYYPVLPGHPAARLLKAFGASVITHPLLWLAFASPLPWSYWATFAAGESAVVLVEAAYLRALGVPAPLRRSLAANLASMSAGLLLNGLGVLPLSRP